MKAQGYHPWDYYNSNPQLKQAIDQIESGYFSKGNRDLFKPLVDLSKTETILTKELRSQEPEGGSAVGGETTAAGGEPLRWRASTAGGSPSVGIWRPGFPACSHDCVSPWEIACGVFPTARHLA
nr:hypothetical protein [Brasilonema sennae]